MAQRVRATYAGIWNMSEDEVLTRFNTKIPMGRYGQPMRSPRWWTTWPATTPRW